jgi:hypothetical protein
MAMARRHLMQKRANQHDWLVLEAAGETPPKF